jgi:uncharacterized RDD family membrane protein YckC
MSRHIVETEGSLIIETPERVPLEFALASIGNRFLAVAIDHFIQYCGIFLIAWLIYSVTTVGGPESTDQILSEMPNWTKAFLILAAFLMFAGYFIMFEWLWNGQTPGKRLLKLRVIRDDGRPITLWEAIARNLLRICDAAPGFIVPIYSVGLVTIFVSGRDQRLGDVFAGTVVVRERTAEAPTFAETFSNPVSDTAFSRVQKRIELTADVSNVTESQIEVVESFLRRRWDLTDRQRVWMAWRIALPLMYQLRPRYDMADFTYEGFLEELLARFHARQRFLN